MASRTFHPLFILRRRPFLLLRVRLAAMNRHRPADLQVAGHLHLGTARHLPRPVVVCTVIMLFVTTVTFPVMSIA